MKESQPGTTEIELQDTPSLAFSALLKYIYSGRMNLVQIQEENLLDILSLSHRFGFVELELSISDYLKAILNIRNVCHIYDLANIYSLTSLCNVCKDYIDRHAQEVLNCESFLSLSQASMRDLISRDSFCAPEIEIFRSVCNWAEHNKGQDPTPILDAVRLQLMGMHELLNNVRQTGLVSSDAILDAIKVQTESRDMDLKYRGFLVMEENVATTRLSASVVRGEMKTALLDGDTHNYDLDRGFTRHPIDDNNGTGIVIKLGQPYIINSIKLLLWDKDMRSYSYFIEVSMDDKDYERVIDHSGYLCRSWQKLHFPGRVVRQGSQTFKGGIPPFSTVSRGDEYPRYIKVVGTHNTVNRVFHLVSFECLYTNKPFQVDRGLTVPTENVATIKHSALVIEGVSRSRNALIDGETRSYDWDSGYTCHQLGSGAICIQLAQPYILSNMRLLLWDCDDRSYSFYIEVSTDQQKWMQVVDKRHEACKSWQTVTFEPLPVTFIRIVGTHNTANEVFHCVHFESPADTSVDSLLNSMANVTLGATGGGASAPAGLGGGAAAGQSLTPPRQLHHHQHHQHHQQQGRLFPGQDGGGGGRGEGGRSHNGSNVPLSRSNSSTASSSRSEGQQNRVNFPPYYGPPLPPAGHQQLQPNQEVEAAGAVGGAQAHPNHSPPQGLALAEPIQPAGHYVGHMLQQDAPEADWMDIR
ncbi:BTB/POZ domain-containing protein 9 [Elysia marginata]|uniref:BTB/POZ domain-containing protein 9 n=1 Tax=Elysia marginata TaxID=1093978 RepID=A0AAV4H6A7_9GAST|nr:BTB/POZ domain-containing protein 9 [Elysia marginata]